MTLHVAREDALPEGIEYRDDGCDWHPACLTCPFEKCRYEESYPSVRRAEREAQRLRDSGMTVDEIASAMGRSRRGVFRYLAAGRKSGG